MKSYALLLLALATVACAQESALKPVIDVTLLAHAEPNTLTDAEKADGWRLLFDGKTTNGWVALGKGEFPDGKGWVVEDGALVHKAQGGGGDIVTKEMFSDFELTWEWKVELGANTGLKYNLPDANKNVGFEYQLIDDEHHPDGIKGGRLHQTGSLYDAIEPPADKKVNPPGEWNSSRILVQGNHVEQWLNGAKTCEFEMSSEALMAIKEKSKFKKTEGWGVKTKSPILLQDHGDGSSFRSIKIRVPGGK
jgi:hypothetical protein